MTDWISVNDRLPDEIEGMSGILIGRDEEQNCHVTMNGIYFDGEFYALSIAGMNKTVEITHWMPLPEPPGDNNE